MAGIASIPWNISVSTSGNSYKDAPYFGGVEARIIFCSPLLFHQCIFYAGYRRLLMTS
jgi:hypothetical protein